MQLKVREYLNQELKVGKSHFSDKTIVSYKGNDSKALFQFVCGGIRGLIRYKFPLLTNSEIVAYHESYVKEKKLKKLLVSFGN